MLILQAQEPANWERGQGRGRDHASRAAAPQQVVFGGRASGDSNSGRPTQQRFIFGKLGNTGQGMICAAGFGTAKASRPDPSVSGRTSVSGRGGGSGGAGQRLEGLHAGSNAKGSQSTSPTAGKLRRQAPLPLLQFKSPRTSFVLPVVLDVSVRYPYRAAWCWEEIS